MLSDRLHVGRMELPNRIIMAPMTRMRATESGVPTPEMVEYYRQRATAGLIVTEGTFPSTAGQSEWRIPGLQTREQTDGWRPVVDAVHSAGGRIVAQLMHGGRNGHPLVRIDGTIPAGPSAVRRDELVHVPGGGKVPSITPRELTDDEIERAIDDYDRAAENAISAGFDGIEIHAANSYLPHQFLADNTNLRHDRWGSTPDGRMRFTLEVVDRVAERIGADRTGIRLSPGNEQFGMREAHPAPLYRALVIELARRGLAYLHLSEGGDYPALRDLRPRWNGVLIANVGENREATTREDADRLLGAGLADAVSFGRGFLANPDLPARLAIDAPWNPVDERTLYTPGPRGYTDYPPMQRAAVPACA